MQTPLWLTKSVPNGVGVELDLAIVDVQIGFAMVVFNLSVVVHVNMRWSCWSCGRWSRWPRMVVVVVRVMSHVTMFVTIVMIMQIVVNFALLDSFSIAVSDFGMVPVVMWATSFDLKQIFRPTV